MKVRGVIFDMDGTLLDTIEDIGAAVNSMLTAHGYPVHRVEDYIKWIGNGAVRLVELAVPSEPKPLLLDVLVEEFRINYQQNLHHKTCLYDGVGEVIDFLEERGIFLSILSNKPDHLTREVARWYLSEWDFRFIYGQREGIPRKPDPLAALALAEEMGLDPGEIMFIGDSGNDMITARRGGFVPVGVLWGYGTERDIREGGAEFVIRKPEELIPILNGLT
ncbi:MAG: HAD family hydrolase [Bacteroidales bacterium]|nr:HAD family hydrolase [Bacteroidales bacterium]MBN2697257.1 HAD family hydrolase [Bacteroidales bacterium]